MNRSRLILITGMLHIVFFRNAVAQTSSVGARTREERVHQLPEVAPREAPRISRNAVYDRYSWISVPSRPPKTFRPGDLITIVVRETRKFKANADLDTKKEFDVESQLDAFLKFTQGGVGASTFRRGKPNISYQYQNEIKGEADAQRKDELTTRLTGKILDVKPNGLLVIEATSRLEHDEEVTVMTLTGTCRKEDVTPDNTVLSTQMADKSISVQNEGALRANTSRGWIPRLIDWIKPF
jgi:flagellar L-ring protein precursor FlgH